jgi:crossover junction endodeoxyribonuclease RuvC
MKILAMDLSITCPAFAVTKVENGKVTVLHLSHVKTSSTQWDGARLLKIAEHMRSILEQHPDILYLVREKGFSHRPMVTQKLFRVVGVSDLVAHQSGYKAIKEYTPTSVKKAVTGNGKADKDFVAMGVSAYLNINIQFKTDDESDAVAVAITFYKDKKLIK